MEPIQVSESIVVRPWHTDDAEELYQAIKANYDHLSVWFGWPEYHTSVQSTRAWIADGVNGTLFKTRIAGGVWENDVLVGSLGFDEGNFLNRSVGLGYWLAKEKMGQGLMTAVVGAVSKHLFINKRVNRVVIKAIEANEKSCAIPERLGFTFEGVERDGILLRGRYYNVKVYSLLSHEVDLI